LPGIGYFQTSTQTLGSTHGNSAHDTVTQLLLDFQRQVVRVSDIEGIVNLGDGVSGKLYVDDRADY
jgi:hypothetical protein